ncbi:hypothetical protein SSX86_001771 [Deinandra increscens subsp. villosa]|uniref:No apical meristem-associated C-terminal domain-containing protein n=1 Tax=Deinandra increscens subsp. villosa TaxID=3103831 RepID=A0AAP0DS07_9ASTR
MDSEDQEMNFTTLLSQDDYHLGLDDSPTIPHDNPTNVNKCARARGINFSLEEDKLLVSAWLNCSIDAVQGTDQKYAQLWEKIFGYFQQHRETTAERTIKSLIHRWSCIHRATNKFCAKLAQVESLNQSGITEQDKLEKAKVMYQAIEKSNFQFEHCWHLLKDQAKWISRSTKQRKAVVPSPTPTITPSSTQNVIENEIIELERPMGRKAAKAKRKAQGRQVEEVMELKKMRYTLLEESRIQEKEFYRLKAEKMEYDKEKENKRLCLEDEKLRMEAEKLRIKSEKVDLAKKEKEERIMMMDVSIMPEMQRLYFEKRQREIIMNDDHV